jgi:hypothetical protein
MSINKFDSGGIYPPPQTPDNEVARLRWEIKISADGITPYLWDNRKYDNYDLGSLCRILNEYEEKTNEVARLGELLNRNGDELNTFHHTKEEAFALAEKAMPLWECVVIKRNTSDGLLFLGGWQVTTSGYRPAPEEAVVVNPEPSSSVVDQKPDNVSDKHEWRELGPDEVIHTGDEVQAKHHDRLHGVWLNVLPYEMGAMPIDHEAFRYRTRRPLPKQEEMPLEDEIVRLQEVGRLNYAEGQQDLTDCLRYLRDEIEQLKKNQK